ncbi:hypothetical protein C2G38_2217187 [Gigaspora rosea]|uniref:F-box domain-containing protein n=1 Tax=Gigaspora rosea TaxID=44941 RepID=A0A397U9N3_9GLOM|nr:hypothetical protein C2G38_2217187 [Gigaspora rosea]
MSIPILWQDPFSIKQSSLFIPIYFSSLGEDEKLVVKEYLKEFGINIEFSEPIFDYARFLKVLYIYQLASKVREWMILQYLSLEIISNFDIENIAKLLRVLSKHATKISALRLIFHSEYELKLIHTLLPALIHFIKSQEQLRKFMLDGTHRGDCPTEFYGIISALVSQKNTLQEVTFKDCFFSEEFGVLNNCKNLGALRILDCDNEIMKKFDYNISTLEISHFQIDVPIIAIKSFCPNIIYLYIADIGFSTQLIELIGNLQKLQFLSLRYSHLLYRIPKEERKIRAMQFVRILPSTLQYLDIALGMPGTLLDSFIDILLDHCNAPLKKLLISSGNLNNEKNIKALIRYCTRIRTLNYVGIVKYHDLGDDIRNELEKYLYWHHINMLLLIVKCN